MSQTLSVAAGEDNAWALALTGPDGLPAVYDLASTFEANVYQGPNSPVIFHPTAAFSGTSGSVVKLAVAGTQTADLPPRNYNLQVWIRPAGTSERLNIFDGYLSLTQAADVTPGTATTTPGAVSQGNAPARLGAVYCTDEDIAEEVPFDYVSICPKDQAKAKAWDGAFLLGDPWTLTSVSVDFGAAGVGPNDVIYMTKPTAVFGSNGIGTLMAVDSVTGHTATLRRVYGKLYEGAAPVPGALTGVEFTVLTFRPQIERVCYRLRKRFSIDDNIPDQANSLLYDPLELREAAVLGVVKRAYEMKGDKSDYAHKATAVGSDLAAAEGQLELHWGALGMGRAATSTLFGRCRR